VAQQMVTRGSDQIEIAKYMLTKVKAALNRVASAADGHASMAFSNGSMFFIFWDSLYSFDFYSFSRSFQAVLVFTS
jgi:hypothetical protein